jgi:hypothetical protein
MNTLTPSECRVASINVPENALITGKVVGGKSATFGTTRKMCNAIEFTAADCALPKEGWQVGRKSPSGEYHVYAATMGVYDWFAEHGACAARFGTDRHTEKLVIDILMGGITMNRKNNKKSSQSRQKRSEPFCLNSDSLISKGNICFSDTYVSAAGR